MLFFDCLGIFLLRRCLCAKQQPRCDLLPNLPFASEYVFVFLVLKEIDFTTGHIFFFQGGGNKQMAEKEATRDGWPFMFPVYFNRNGRLLSEGYLFGVARNENCGRTLHTAALFAPMLTYCLGFARLTHTHTHMCVEEAPFGLFGFQVNLACWRYLPTK